MQAWKIIWGYKYLKIVVIIINGSNIINTRSNITSNLYFLKPFLRTVRSSMELGK